LAYTIIGSTMIVVYQVQNSDVTGTVSALRITIPAGKTAAKNALAPCARLLDANVEGRAFAAVASGGTTIDIRRQDSANFTVTSSDNTSVSGQIIFEIQ
jgi:hypothetical protein